MSKKGRPKIDPNEKAICRTFSLDKETNELLDALTKNMGMKPSTAIQYLIRQAGKDQLLRNILVNSYVADRRSKIKEPWECTKTKGYHTILKKDGSLFTYYVDPSITVDQRNNDNTHPKREEVSDEEIDKLLDDLYGPMSQEQLNAIYDKYLDEEGQPKWNK